MFQKLFTRPVLTLIALSGAIVGAVIIVIGIAGGDSYIPHAAEVVTGIATGAFAITYAVLKFTDKSAQ